MRGDETVSLLKVFYQMSKREQVKMIKGFEQAATDERRRLLAEMEKLT